MLGELARGYEIHRFLRGTNRRNKPQLTGPILLSCFTAGREEDEEGR